MAETIAAALLFEPRMTFSFEKLSFKIKKTRHLR